MYKIQSGEITPDSPVPVEEPVSLREMPDIPPPTTFRTGDDSLPVQEARRQGWEMINGVWRDVSAFAQPVHQAAVYFVRGDIVRRRHKPNIEGSIVVITKNGDRQTGAWVKWDNLKNSMYAEIDDLQIVRPAN